MTIKVWSHEFREKDFAVEEDMRLTILWREMRERLVDDIDRTVIDTETRTKMFAFVEKHWSSHAPRQHEFHVLEQRLRKAENERDDLKSAIKALQKTTTYGG